MAGDGGTDGFEKLVKPAFQPGNGALQSVKQLPPVSPRMLPQKKVQGFGPESFDEEESKGDPYPKENRFRVHIAAHEGNLTELLDALEANCNFHPYDDSMRTPLYYCAAADNTDCVDALCRTRPDIIDLGDDEGDTALHISSYYGNRDSLTMLLHFKANPNSQNTKGFTPLHVCSSVECCKILIDYGGNLFAQDQQGRNPLFSACATNKVRIVTEILNNPRYDATQMLMVQDSFGDSALHAAACNGSLDCVKALKGFIDLTLVRVTNYKGYTAEDLAKMNQQHECAQYLHDLMITLYKAQDDLLRSGSVDPRRYSMFHQSSNWGGGGSDFMYNSFSRPGTAGGFPYIPGQESMISHGGFGGGGYGGDMMFHGYSNRRPQSAQSFSREGSIRGIGVDGFQDEKDVWNALSKPFEDPMAYSSYKQRGTLVLNGDEEEDRPKTPWTLRREKGVMGDWYGEWAQFIDEETHQPFWWNAISGQCQWDTPDRVKASFGDDTSKYQDPNSAWAGSGEVSEAEQIRQRSFVLDRFGEWSECQDSVTGDIFYYNSETGECEWELPSDAQKLKNQMIRERETKLREQAEEEAKDWLYTFHNKSQEEKLQSTVYQEALKRSGWSMAVDSASGANYYIHNTTGETSWEEPLEVTEEKEKVLEKKMEENMNELKEKIKAEAAEEIAKQVKAAITSTEEEREKIRQEFEEKMRAAAEQTEKLAKQLEGETDAARKRKEAEILRFREKEKTEEEKSKRSEEKAELLAEHGEEIKQLASVLSADRMRQNEKLQEKLKERRRERALKRAQMMNQAKEVKSPNSPNSPVHRIPLSPVVAAKFGLTPKSNPSNASSRILTVENLDDQGENDSVTKGEPQTLSDLFSQPAYDFVETTRKQSEKFNLLVSMHAQYLSTKDIQLLEAAALKIDLEKAKRLEETLWAVFRTFAAENKRSALPTKLNEDALKLFLDQGNLKLALSAREDLVQDMFSKTEGSGESKFVRFNDFLNIVVKIMDGLGCDSLSLFKATLMPICLRAFSALEKKLKVYQLESKALATNQVRQLLQSNISQLKIVYMYYTLVAEKRKSSCPKKNLTMEEIVIFAKDFGFTPDHCSVRQLVHLYGDMSLRKPGDVGSLEFYVLPFNQWVQFLFHAAIRFFKKASSTNIHAGEGENSAHENIIAMFEHMDHSGGKDRIKAKGLGPFICVVGGSGKEGTTVPDNGQQQE